MPDAATAEADTRRWLERAVIGLNLCPFARQPFAAGRVRFRMSDATEPETLLEHLRDELTLLDETSPEEIETTLLIHPGVFQDFLDFNDFLGVAEETVEELGMEGTLQVASFHPDYRFAGTAPDDVENCTNRSPWPTLHLLRESSIDRAVEAVEDTDAIYERNIETMRRIGHEGFRKVMDGSDGGGPERG